MQSVEINLWNRLTSCDIWFCLQSRWITQEKWCKFLCCLNAPANLPLWHIRKPLRHFRLSFLAPSLSFETAYDENNDNDEKKNKSVGLCVHTVAVVLNGTTKFEILYSFVDFLTRSHNISCVSVDVSWVTFMCMNSDTPVSHFTCL